MVESISQVGGPGGVVPSQPGMGRVSGGQSFKDLLIDSMKRVNDMQLEADQAINRLAAGQTDNVAEVMTAVEKADLAFQLLMQIRNKLVDAYQEVRQMRI